MRATSFFSAPDKVSISSRPELELLIVVNGVLKACARPSSTADRSCSLCRAASALLSAEKERALSIATAVNEAVARGLPLVRGLQSECLSSDDRVRGKI